MIPRLYVDADLAEDLPVALERSQAHQLRNVLRLKPGAALSLFNGRQGEWSARLDSLMKSSAVALARAQQRPQRSCPDLWLLFAPIKRTALDFLVAKATELGVGALVPILTRRTVVERVNRERMRAIAIEAAEQCERLDVPVVHAPRPLGQVLSTWPAERRLIVCAERGQARPLADVLAEAAEGPQARAAPWALAVGPEGGLEAGELDLLQSRPACSTAGLGPRILRAETAALASLACWQAILGDGACRPTGQVDHS